MQDKFEPIKFPKDELSHDCVTEWWYFNGHLEDERQNKYSFMNCLFKVDVKRSDFKKLKIPFLNKVPLKTIYFPHSILLDIKRKKFYSKIDYVSLISRDSFSKQLLFINYINPITVKGYTNKTIEGIDKFKYRLKTEDIDLILTSVKKPLLEGGNGYIDFWMKGSYYYSLTNLKTEGTIRIENRLIKVKGKSWMDHQWANKSYSRDKWTWFSIQLDNETEMVCFKYDNGGAKAYLASISYPDDKQEHISEVKLTPLGTKWTSPKTKAEYHLSWRIEIPSKAIDLEVTPLVKDQEMIFGTINYWEGPLTVKGLFNNQKVNGVGFLEISGCLSEYTNLKFTKDEVEKIISKSLFYTKKGARSAINNIRTRIAKK